MEYCEVNWAPGREATWGEMRMWRLQTIPSLSGSKTR